MAQSAFQYARRDADMEPLFRQMDILGIRLAGKVEEYDRERWELTGPTWSGVHTLEWLFAYWDDGIQREGTGVRLLRNGNVVKEATFSDVSTHFKGIPLREAITHTVSAWLREQKRKKCPTKSSS